MKIREAGISLFVALSLLLIAILGETYLGYFLLPIFAGVILIIMLRSIYLMIYKKNFIEENYLNLSYVSFFLLWVFWLIWFFTSVLFSQAIPFSLDQALKHLVGWVVFWFFADMAEAKKYQNAVILGSIIGITIMQILSFFFMLFQQYASLLPGLNLLFPTYGHNHLASLLIFYIPFIWILSLTKTNKWLITLVVFLCIGFTFGRIAITIGFFQLLFLILMKIKFYKKNYIFNVDKKKLIITIFIVLSVFLILFTQIFYAIKDKRFFAVFCSKSFFSKLICKPFKQDSRPEYWSQAITATRNHPIFGYGPGTFSFVNAKYYKEDRDRTSYAHQEILQNFSETGVVGGLVFTLIIIFWLYIGFVRISKVLGDTNLRDFADLFFGLALISSIVNSQFDFDWRFSVIWILTAFVAGSVFNQFNTHVNKSTIISSAYVKIILKVKLLIYGLLFLLAAIFLFLFILIESLIRLEKIDVASQIFPYFRWHYVLFLNHYQSNSEREKLNNIYKNVPDYYKFSILLENNDLIFKGNDLIRLSELSPSELWIQQPTIFQELVSVNERDLALFLLEKYSIIWSNQSNYFGYFPKYNSYLLLEDSAWDLATSFFVADEPEKAAKTLILLQRINSWSLNTDRNKWPIFQDEKCKKWLTEELNNYSKIEENISISQCYQKTTRFFKVLSDSIEPNFISNHSEWIGKLIVVLGSNFLSENYINQQNKNSDFECINFKECFSIPLQKIAPNSKWIAWDKWSQEMEKLLLNKNLVKSRDSLIETWFQMLVTLSDEKIDFDLTHRKILARYLFDSYMTNPVDSIKRIVSVDTSLFKDDHIIQNLINRLINSNESEFWNGLYLLAQKNIGISEIVRHEIDLKIMETSDINMLSKIYNGRIAFFQLTNDEIQDIYLSVLKKLLKEGKSNDLPIWNKIFWQHPVVPPILTSEFIEKQLSEIEEINSNLNPKKHDDAGISADILYQLCFLHFVTSTDVAIFPMMNKWLNVNSDAIDNILDTLTSEEISQINYFYIRTISDLPQLQNKDQRDLYILFRKIFEKNEIEKKNSSIEILNNIGKKINLSDYKSLDYEVQKLILISDETYWLRLLRVSLALETQNKQLLREAVLDCLDDFWPSYNEMCRNVKDAIDRDELQTISLQPSSEILVLVKQDLYKKN